MTRLLVVMQTRLVPSELKFTDLNNSDAPDPSAQGTFSDHFLVWVKTEALSWIS